MVPTVTFPSPTANRDDGGSETSPAAPATPQTEETSAPSLPQLPSLPRLPDVAPRRPMTEAAAPGFANPGAPPSPTQTAFARLAQAPAQPTRRVTPIKRRRGRSRVRYLRRLIGLAAILLLAARSGRTYIEQWLDDEPTDGSASADVVTEWDPRVTDIVAFVTAERGLTFDHPVAVEFLAEEDFVALFTETPDSGETDATEPPPSPEELALLADEQRAIAAWYDAMGLAAGYVPAAADSTSVAAIASLGFYSPYEDKVYIRGDQLTPPVRVVLAHELTHALQAQHFDIRLGGDDDLAVRSLVEADAMRVEEAYLATMPLADQELARAGNSLGDSDEAALDVIPWAVVEASYAPYAIGPMLVASTYAASGNAGVDALLSDPPSEEVLISPWLRTVPQTDVAPPVVVPPGARVVQEEQRLSMFDMIVALDAWLSWGQARGAIDGWAGGRMVMYERDGAGGPICVGATIAFDADPAPMAAALTAWAAAAGSTAIPAVVDRQVSFEACPRGATAAAPPDPVVSPTEEIVLEHAVLEQLDPVAPPEVLPRYLCYARTLIDDPSLAPLMFEAELDADEEAVLTWVTTAAADTCGLTG